MLSFFRAYADFVLFFIDLKRATSRSLDGDSKPFSDEERTCAKIAGFGMTAVALLSLILVILSTDMLLFAISLVTFLYSVFHAVSWFRIAFYKKK